LRHSWNFPVAIPVWKIAPALVAGNTVVFKPASLNPRYAVRVVQISAKQPASRWTTFPKGYPGERFLRNTIALLCVRAAKRRRRIAASSTGTTAPAVRWSFLLMD